MKESKIYVQAQMLIRKPVDLVFRAFTDPAVTTNFWFTHSTGILEEGKTVKWTWEMYAVSTNVYVEELLDNRKLRIRWGDPSTLVEFFFTPYEEGSTYVEIKNHGFVQTGEELLHEINNNTGGFTTVLDGAKAFLEFGLKLNLIADKFPGISKK